MCTIGLLRLAEDDYVLFKNKDFVRSRFEDRLVVESEIFGAMGTTTWAGADGDSDHFSGLSIGANASGLLCCDANVRTLEDHENYDDLVEIALRSGTDVGSATDAVRSAVDRKPYLWANLLMIDANRSASIEVRSNRVEVVPLDGPTARANHHVVMGANEEDDDTVTSQLRYESAQRRIESVSTLEDVFALQRSHDNGDTGVCNHSLYQTVYSYVLRYRGGKTSLYVSQGHPCENSTPEELVLPIGKPWSITNEAEFRAAYPSTESLQLR